MSKNTIWDKKIIMSIITLSIPILLANLLQSAYQLIDAYWVWRLWENAVAAVWVSFPITFFIISLGSWFSIAWATLIAQYYWAKKYKMVNHVAAQTILLVVLVSILLSILWFFSAWFLLNLMWVDDAVYSQALSFLRISFTWMVFIFSFFMFQSILRWIWEVKMPMKIVLFTVILNFILDPLFIFWFWIIPAFWVSWAAITTVITQSIASLIWIYLLFKWNYWIKINFASFKPDFWYIKKAFYLWLPSSLEMSSRSLWLVALTFIIAWFGTQTVASFWAGWNILQLVMIMWLWLSMATSVLVGQNIWAKNFDLAEKIIKLSSIISFAVLTFIWIIVFLFAKYFVWFFVPGEEWVIDMWARFLQIIALWFWLIWVQMTVTWVFRASGQMNAALVLSLISQWVLQIPIIYYLANFTTLWTDWIWYWILITNILMFFISLYLLNKWSWKNKNLTQEDVMQEKVFEDVAIEDAWLRN